MRGRAEDFGSVGMFLRKEALNPKSWRAQRTIPDDLGLGCRAFRILKFEVRVEGHVGYSLNSKSLFS